MKKRLLSAMLAMLMVLSLCPVYVSAGDEELKVITGGAYYKDVSRTSYSFDDLTVTGTDIKSIQIMFTSVVKAEDDIKLPALPTGWVLVTSFNTGTSKVINIAAGAAPETVRDFLRQVVFKKKDIGSTHQIRILISGEIVTQDDFYYYRSETGHYYQTVDYGNATQPWIGALNDALSRTYMGQRGYLACIDDEVENQFLYTITAGQTGWFGGTRADLTYEIEYDDDAEKYYPAKAYLKMVSGDVTYYYDGEFVYIFNGKNYEKTTSSGLNVDSFRTGAVIHNYWYWACGPRLNIDENQSVDPTKSVFLNRGTHNGTADDEIAAYADAYSKWNSGEPNNSGSEYYVTTLKDGGGDWNDLPLLGGSGAYKVYFAFIEFGDDVPGGGFTSGTTEDKEGETIVDVDGTDVWTPDDIDTDLIDQITKWYNDSPPDATTYEIKTADDLAGLSYLVNQGTDDFSGKTILLSPELDKDENKVIDLSKNIWTPIGTEDKPFKGTLDGNGTTITGVTIAQEAKDTRNDIGLIGNMVGGAVKDIILDGEVQVQISGSGSTETYIGSIVGRQTDGTRIENCESSIRLVVQGGSSTSTLHVGGLVGQGDGSVIANSSYTGVRIEVDATASAAYIGGLTGSAADADIKNAYSRTPLNVAVAVAGAGIHAVGGIAGLVSQSSTLRNLYSACTLPSDGSASRGGITGTGDITKEKVSNCYYLEGPGNDGCTGMTAADGGTLVSNVTITDGVRGTSLTTDDLMTALHEWVAVDNSGTYRSWIADDQEANGGFPVFGSIFPPSYNVTLTIGDESVTVRVPKDKPMPKPEDPVREGYEFDKWLDNNTKKEWNFDTSIDKEGITLIPTWTVTSYSITYELNGGVNYTGAPATYTIESPEITLGAPTKTGYTFSDWYDAATDGNSVTKIPSGSTGDIKVYARWTANTYTVSFNTGDNSVQAVYDGKYPTLPVPTDTARIFDGWYLNEALTGSAVTTETTVKTADDHTLYVKWVDKAAISIEEATQSAVYDGSAKTFAVIEPEGKNSGDFTVEYKVNGQYTTTPPTDAGAYDVKITRPFDDATKAFEAVVSGGLVIEKAPVTFTLDDNLSFPFTGTAKGATVGQKEGEAPAIGQDGFQVLYKKGDTSTASPTEVGTYEIWVVITDPNFKHNRLESSVTERKLDGTLEIQNAVAPQLSLNAPYGFGTQDATVDFAITKGTNAFDYTLTLQPVAGEKQTVAASGNDMIGDISRQGLSLSALTPDTEYMLCLEAVDTASGESVSLVRYFRTLAEEAPVREVPLAVKDSADDPLEDATIILEQGNTVIASGVTDSNGAVTLPNVPDGIYNLVVEKSDGTRVTQVIKVPQDLEALEDGDALEVGLPNGNQHTLVEVAGNAPRAVVEGLDDQFTPEDQTAISGGSVVEIKLQVTDVAEDDNYQAQRGEIQASASGQTLALYFDLSVFKTIIENNGFTEGPKPLGEIPNMLSIRIPVPEEAIGKSNLRVFRFHSGAAAAMPTSNGGNPDTEWAEIGSDHIVLHVQRFSVYAIAYTPYFVLEPLPEVTGEASGGGSLVIEAGDGGTVKVDPETAAPGEKQTVSVEADEGYVIADILVDGKSLGEADYGASYTCILEGAEGGHTLQVIFKKADSADPGDGLPYYYQGDRVVFIGFANPVEGVMKYIRPGVAQEVFFRPNPKAFTDIADSWAREDIDFVTQREIFVGVEANIFAPDLGMTRAMFAVIMARLAHAPLEAEASPFADVDLNIWYGPAVAWAAGEGLVQGYGDGSYRPEQQISRQEMAAMLQRFAAYMELEPTATPDQPLTCPDADAIADWAVDGATYCQAYGIIVGRAEEIFDPEAFATRAEVAAMLTRLIKLSVQ